MKTPTETLRDEHRLILQALTLLEAATERLERGGPTPETWWAELLAWLRAFADRNHHAKEERALFPAMARAGMPAEGGGPVAVMLEEHAEGRALVQAMVDGEAGPRAAAARRYIDLLRAHIDKENDILFPLADALIDEVAQGTLARQLDAVAAEMGRDACPDYAAAVLHGLAAALAGPAVVAGDR